MTFEPLLGERVIYRPAAPTDEEIENSRHRLIRRWRQKIGHDPLVYETISLHQVLARIREAVALDSKGPRASDTLSEAIKQIDAAIKLVMENKAQEQLATSSADVVGLLDSIGNLSSQSVVNQYLQRVHPFELQGGQSPGERFLVVIDPQSRNQKFCASVLELTGGRPYVVWIDWHRMRPDDWQRRPPWLVTYERGHPCIIWNHFKDLNPLQIRKSAYRPSMIHQCAQRIAQLWEQETGRRPEVKVKSFIRLNYREPRQLVDPDVDFASRRYKLFSHNEWILPLLGQRLSKSDSQPSPSRMK